MWIRPTVFDLVTRSMRAGDRLTRVRDPEEHDPLVGSGVVLPQQMTFPGGRPHPVAAVPFVAVPFVDVRAGWRRHGILSALMRDQLHGRPATAGEPVAVLTADVPGRRCGRGRYRPASAPTLEC